MFYKLFFILLIVSFTHLSFAKDLSFSQARYLLTRIGFAPSYTEINQLTLVLAVLKL